MAREGSASICVCVPVRNERRRLPVMLRAFARQERGPPHGFTLCILFDSCSDGSETLAQALAPELPFPVVTGRTEACDAPNAGRARRAAMALGQAHLAGSQHGLLLTTDADSAPDGRWIASAVEALRHADVATGRIVRAGARDRMQDRVELYYDRLHAFRRQLDPVAWEAQASHHFTGGANMAFRAAAYAQLGGFSPVGSGEDARIVDEAHRAGLRVRRDAAMVVRTSARRRGRATGGLAENLLQLSGEEGRGIRVTHPADAAWQWEGHALARRAHALGSTAGLSALSARIRTPLDSLERTAAETPHAEAFATRVVPAAPWARMVSLAEAEAALDLLHRPQELAA